MKAIDIQINQAKIQSYSVTLFDDKVPSVSAVIGLYSGTKQISTFHLETKSYYNSGVTFELPADMIDPIVDIAKQLEVILVRECNKQLKRLPKSQAIEND
jgi:hypothetical protein